MSSNAIAKIEFDKDQLAVIESQFFPTGATKAEQLYCFTVARELGLNPITREIYFVPRRQKVGERWVNKVEPMVGRDGFLSIAHRTNQLAGIETTAGIREIPQLENGRWVVKPQLTAESTVWRKDSRKPFTAQVAYNEYCQKSSDGSPTRFWAEKPETMLKKVAESQALRKAFNIHGVYCPEEVGAGFETENGEIIQQAIEAEFTSSSTEKPPLSVVPTPSPAPTVIEGDGGNGGAGDKPVASVSPEPTGGEGTISEVISLLETRGIPYEVDDECGIISAKSYNHKELLKQHGFRWSPEIKAWVFQFAREPF